MNNTGYELPHSIEAEQCVLGAVLQDPRVLSDVCELITANDFFSELHRETFAAMQELEKRDEQVNVITLTELLIHEHEGVLGYLCELQTGIAGCSNVLSYANVVRSDSVKRSIIKTSQNAIKYVFENPMATSDEVVNFAQSQMVSFEDVIKNEFVVSDLNQALKNYVINLDSRYKRGDELNGYSMGFKAIDGVIDGLKKKHLFIIAGRPSMGKTTYALQVAGALSLFQNLRGLFFSLEMSENELTEKLIACFGHINLDFLQNPKKHQSEDIWPRLEAAAGKIKKAPLHIADCSDMHINQVKAYARKFHRKTPLDFIVVDHIHLMCGDGDREDLRLGSISRGLKLLAKQLDIPIIALAQLNRSVEDRTIKRPVMSDLRGSGSIEQDADVIQFVYREDYYNQSETCVNKGLVEIITAKHRGGKLGSSTLGNIFCESRMIDTDRFMQSEPPAQIYTKKRPSF